MYFIGSGTQTRCFVFGGGRAWMAPSLSFWSWESSLGHRTLHFTAIELLRFSIIYSHLQWTNLPSWQGTWGQGVKTNIIHFRTEISISLQWKDLSTTEAFYRALRNRQWYTISHVFHFAFNSLYAHCSSRAWDKGVARSYSMKHCECLYSLYNLI